MILEKWNKKRRSWELKKLRLMTTGGENNLIN